MRSPPVLAQITRALLALWLTLGLRAHAALEPIRIAKVDRPGPVDFEKEILPVLKQNCLSCHNQTKPKGGLTLETPRSILKGGDTGPAILTNKPAESLLLLAASHRDADLEMPPPENKVSARPLTPDELGLIQLWIQQGGQGEVHGLGPIVWKPLAPSLHTIFAAALTRDGQFAACGRGNRIFIYQIPTGQLTAEVFDPRLQTFEPPGAAHHDTVNALAFSKDGELLASGGYREIKIWRRVKPAQTWRSTQSAEILSATASPDGQWVATVNQEGGLWLWPSGGEPPALLLEDPGEGATAVFSPDSSRLALASSGFLRILKVAGGAVEAQSRAFSNLTTVCWIGETNLALGGASGSIRLCGLDPVEGLLTPGHEIKTEGKVVALETAPGLPNRFLSAGGDGSVTLWDVKTGKSVFKTKLGSAPSALALRSDGRMVAASSGATVKLFKVSDASLVAEMKGDRRLADAVAVCGHEETFAKSEIEYRQGALKGFESNRVAMVERKKKAEEAVAGAAKILLEKQALHANALALEAAAARELDEFLAGTRAAIENYLEAENEGKNATNLLADAKTALDKFPGEAKEKRKSAAKKLANARKKTESAAKDLEPFAIAKSTADHELDLASDALRKADESAPGLKSGLAEAEAALQRAETALKTAQRRAAEAEQPVQTLAFSPDNALLLTGDQAGALRTWSAETGAPCDTVGVLKGVKTAVFFAPARFVAATATGATGWDLTSKWRLDLVIGTGGSGSPIADRVNALEFTPDGKCLMSGGGEPSRDGEIKFWDTADGGLIREFKHLHSDSVFSLDLSPDGQYLASAGADRFARITDLATGKVAKNLEGHANHVLGVGWARDGRTLVTAGADNQAKTWDFETSARRKNIEGFSKEVTSVSFLGFGGRAVLTSGDGQVVVVGEDGGKVKTLRADDDYLYAGAVSADGRTIVAGGSDGILRVWTGADWKDKKTFAP